MEKRTACDSFWFLAFQVWHLQIAGFLRDSVAGNGQVMGRAVHQRSQRQSKVWSC